jgi:hypothetical protein
VEIKRIRTLFVWPFLDHRVVEVPPEQVHLKGDGPWQVALLIMHHELISFIDVSEIRPQLLVSIDPLVFSQSDHSLDLTSHLSFISHVLDQI